MFRFYQSDELYDVNVKSDVHGIADAANWHSQKVMRLVWLVFCMKQMF